MATAQWIGSQPAKCPNNGSCCCLWRNCLLLLHLDTQEISCSLNFDTHTGRGKVSLANPRYSGLRGDSLSGGFRWERDVVRLEKLVLQQQRSRCVQTVWHGGKRLGVCLAALVPFSWPQRQGISLLNAAASLVQV